MALNLCIDTFNPPSGESFCNRSSTNGFKQQLSSRLNADEALLLPAPRKCNPTQAIVR